MTAAERPSPPCRSPCNRPANGALLNIGSSLSLANSTAPGRAVGATIKTGSPHWSRAPASARPIELLPLCADARRQMIRPPRPAMSSTSRCHAKQRHGSPRRGPAVIRNVRSAHSEYASPGFGAFLDGRRVSAIAPELRFLARNRRARSAPCFRRSVSVIMPLRQAHNGI